MIRKLNIDKGYIDTKEGRPAGNSTYKKLAVKSLNEVQFFNQTFVQVDSFVLRNRQLLIAANRYNCERKHQSLDYQTPEKLFKKIV